MKNEPVAWIALNQLNNTYSAFTDGDKERMLPHVQQLYANWIQLYTHPAKPKTKCRDSYDTVCPPSICDCRTKTLTDEEIQEAIDSIDWNQSNVLIRFARAILRKAQ